MNFWGYFIQGAYEMLAGTLSKLPNALPASQLFSDLVGWITQLLAPVYYFVSPIMDLRVLGIFLAAILTLEIIRAAIAIYKWIMDMIPIEKILALIAAL